MTLRVLLDTHTLIWWMTEDDSLPRGMRKLIAGKETVPLVSAVSAWEMATKSRLGKLEITFDLLSLEDDLQQLRIDLLPITVDHGVRAGMLIGPHKDPFDRMLVAQAQAEGLPVVSNDKVFDLYGVRRLW